MMTTSIPSDAERCAWYALLVCIVRGCTVDEARLAMNGGWPAAFGRKKRTPEEKLAARNELEKKYRRRPEVMARQREYAARYRQKMRDEAKKVVDD